MIPMHQFVGTHGIYTSGIRSALKKQESRGNCTINSTETSIFHLISGITIDFLVEYFTSLSVARLYCVEWEGDR
jgi:hypothetical protein